MCGSARLVAKETLFKLSWCILHFPRGYNFLRCSTLLNILQSVWAKAVHRGVGSVTSICWCRTAAWAPEALTSVAVWCEGRSWMYDPSLRRYPDTTDFKGALASFFVVFLIWNGTSYGVCFLSISMFIFKRIRWDFAWCVWVSLTLFSTDKLILDIWGNRFIMRKRWSYSLALEIHSVFVAEANNSKVVTLQCKQIWK